ncbi:hypothetical protein [Paraburkholderia sp. MM6662-R1]|uniref:hypothetical protein n=1 Tax=Paraburkholderia sp. MM6662-R1 TaxID=2991066 RepID=UPI003D1E1A22
MRIRTCVESWRSRRAARCDAMCEMAGSCPPSAEAERHSRAQGAARGALRKTVALATIVVATLLAINAVIDASDDLRANPAAGAASDCSARYAALLDLAELARRDGKSSEVVVRGLSQQNGAMSECIPAGRFRPAPP